MTQETTFFRTLRIITLCCVLAPLPVAGQGWDRRDPYDSYNQGYRLPNYGYQPSPADIQDNIDMLRRDMERQEGRRSSEDLTNRLLERMWREQEEEHNRRSRWD